MNYLNNINPGFHILFIPSNNEYERLLDGVANNGNITFVNMGKPFDIKVPAFVSKNSPDKNDILFIKGMLPKHSFNRKLYPVSDKLIFTIYKMLKENDFVVFEPAGVDWEGLEKTAEFCYNYCLKDSNKRIVLIEPPLSNRAPEKQELYAVDSCIMVKFSEWYSSKLVQTI
ncbi:MAG TPA: hypothetical protein VEC12_09995 [Bacteroidia bacterium]|nr:hypothetical protein [Bacteroidia bacterium]